MTPRESRYTAYIGILIGFFAGLILMLLNGCSTIYDISACHTETDVCTTVHVKSYREFEQPQVQYTRTADGVIFTFGAESATTATSPIEQAVADVIRSAPSAILPVPE